jgi:ribosomal-protein-alanine N-acetyltransferase
MTQPVLETERLLLRPFRIGDAADLVRLAGAREIADTTVTIPHPYTGDMAVEWIASLSAHWASGLLAAFAITLRDNGEFVGGAGLSHIDRDHEQAELGYWIGVPYWGRRYAREAAARVLAFGIEDLGLNRIYAHCMLRNPASAAILRRVGMKPEGVQRERVRKWGVYEDVALFAMLRSDPR